MRHLVASSLIGVLVVAAAGAASAQPPASRFYSEPEMSLARRLILEREMYRARQRTGRLEYKRMMGISPQRPTDRFGFGMSNLYRYDVPVIVPAPVPFRLPRLVFATP